jgi:hypothetical protein
VSRNDDTLDKNDLETILKVNAKSIELLTETSDQYEEIIKRMADIEDNEQAIKSDLQMIKGDIAIIKEEVKEEIKEMRIDVAIIKELKGGIKKEIEDIQKTQFKILLLISTGVVNLIVTIISLLASWKH